MAESKQADAAFDDVDKLCVGNIGTFAADVVEKANSGHPGAPMGMSAIAHVLWSKILNASSANPLFANRDRFVLSNGHACALQYTMLHLCGYKVSMEDLKSFRQLNSITPGHPENYMTDGIELSTGPLGQGLAQAVGLAIAGKYAQSLFGEELFNSKVYVFCGDGCLQEGVASEACSLAGHLKLDNLVLLYDDNDIQIDGSTNLAFTESVGKRFEAYDWSVDYVADGNTNLAEILAKIEKAKATKGKPSLIAIKTKIGYASTLEGSHKVHGAPLGTDALKDYKNKLGFNAEETFVVKDAVYQRYKETFVKRGALVEEQWNKLKEAYCQKNPEKGKLLDRLLKNELPENWQAALPKYDETSKPNATRSINGEILNAIAKVVPELIGGAADLTPSTKTELKCSHDFQANSIDGRYLRFGVREFAMFAIANGISAFGLNLVPFSSTFLNFITYGYGALRLGALSHLRQIYIMTHDSVLLGEDGPTHQPVEVLPAVRALPNALLFRPADGIEINECWKVMLPRRNGPSIICLSRQKVNTNLVSKYTKNTALNGVKFGAYILQTDEAEQKEKDVDVVVIATGSEVELALDAAESLKDSLKVRVVSGVCMDLFEQQSLEYKQSVLKPNTLVIAFEASSPYGWDRYAHKTFGINGFGKSAPIKAIREHFGLTAAKFATNITQTVEKWKGVQVPLVPVLYPN